ncbi:hypothetical protein [Eudoraea adriatica]|uniref:hypothetical protein n=1 Tax=Eudoraea adriatica TaxID=446681 RepID=UPI00035FB2D7|nr:hypothetical protein [Eudoraea adriatica]
MLKNILFIVLIGICISSCTLDSVYEYTDIEETEAISSDLTENQFKNPLGNEELEIYNWITHVQLNNGLLTSTEDSNFVSLYDNSLAALAFISVGEYARAEQIFDFFNGKIESEFIPNGGGFFQFRDTTGNNGNTIWLGDNAWLLIALNNYKEKTGNNSYNELSKLLENWIRSLQDEDGGLWGGFRENGQKIHKITEGIITAFNAIEGYDDFHSGILAYLKQERWDLNDRLLVAWPENEVHYYAMDLHSLGYLIFENFPKEVLSKAERYKNTQVASFNGETISGYCFDEDKDVIWLEGTAQMAVAFNSANMVSEANSTLQELQKAQMKNSSWDGAMGIPYATNEGTSYGSSLLWDEAPITPAISSSIWYLFSVLSFNPLDFGRQKNIPAEDMFWNN